METHLYNGLNAHLKKEFSSFHTPGHKGVIGGFPADILNYDLTEITGTDSLYEAEGIISKSEKEYTKLYGSKRTIFSTGGSTLCLQTMLALVARPKGKIAVNRGIHTSVVNTIALLDLEPVWLFNEYDEASGLANPITKEQVKALLKAQPELCGVVVTSPNYYGQNADIKGIAEACHEYDIPLLVDGAHGAHYKFLGDNVHPLDLGADLVCNSLHKTMPALTGAALLHINSDKYVKFAKQRMALFGSTSPSYLVMMSMDIILPELESNYAEKLSRLIQKVDCYKNNAKKNGFLVPMGDCDPARLTVGFGALGYSREEFLEHLHTCKIEPEYMDDYYCVLLPSVNTNDRDWERVGNMIDSAKSGKRRKLQNHSLGFAVQKLSIRDALFAQNRCMRLEDSIGEVAGAMVAPCPPGIPVVMPGEEISRKSVEIMKKSGIGNINVV